APVPTSWLAVYGPPNRSRPAISPRMPVPSLLDLPGRVTVENARAISQPANDPHRMPREAPSGPSNATAPTRAMAVAAAEQAAMDATRPTRCRPLTRDASTPASE